MSIVVDELLRLCRDLGTSSNTPWKAYWNTTPTGDVEDPRIENLCRDRLLERLIDRLERYKIADGFAEVRRPEDTRADMLILNGAGKSLPIEVKRHYHPDLWEAPNGQLRGYALAECSDGHGIYLVFWFGLWAGRQLPARKDGLPKPTFPQALEDMLVADLPAAERERMRVLVFDVSKPIGTASGIT
ncbi:MAG: hypothetical protein ACJ8R9_17960 [Steroidobacteraceae bacterium]